MSTISVIMPVYNTAEFLDQSIQSVLTQSYKDLELILINDASNDGSNDIIKKYKDKDNRIKAFQFDERSGVGRTRNFGMDNATGSYIYFLDSDDYIQDNTLELLIENINGFPTIFGQMNEAHVSQTKIANDELEANNSIQVLSANRFDLIENNSTLHCLCRIDLIKDNNLRFAENITLYSDLFFIVSILSIVAKVPFNPSSLYYKRVRNDPITNPSLMQTTVENRIKDFTVAYHKIKDDIKNYEVHRFLDIQFLRLYHHSIVRYFQINERVDNIFTQLKSITQRLNTTSIKSFPIMMKKEIKAIKQGDIIKFKKINQRHHRFRKIKNALKGKRRFYIQLYRAVFLKLTMKENMVVFESFLGKSYSDSPKYIYEYMIENNMDYQFVWIFNKKRRIPGNAKQVKRFSIQYFYYLARAKYWVNNSRMPQTLNKREGNIYLQTWHGTPLKSLVFDMKDIYSANPAYKRNFYQQSRRWDYLSSPNQYSSDIFRRAFKYENKLLEFGYPRNDILYTKNNESNILDIKQKLNIPVDKKVILYAPTWRDDEFYSEGKYKFELQLDLEKLQEELGNDYVILLRMHYFIASELNISKYEGFVFDYSTYDDIAELYLISDILITDYSSVFFDYANLRRPILFYTYDLEKYRDTLRGFYFNMEDEVPGPLLKNTDEVLNAIININEINSQYEDRYNTFYDKFCRWEDGRAAEKTVKEVFNSNEELNYLQ